MGLIDLAPTFCAIAGLPAAPWMEGTALPVDDGDAQARGFERVLTEWDSELWGFEIDASLAGQLCFIACTPKGDVFPPIHIGTEGAINGLAATRHRFAQPSLCRWLTSSEFKNII